MRRIWPALAALMILTGCTSAPQAPSDTSCSTSQFADDYRIGIGDNLSVNVYRHPDLSTAVIVRPDGKITVPVAGDVAVGGFTPENVSKVIATALSEYIREPIVSVTVAGIGSAEYLLRIRVTGAVNSPQSLPFRNGMTVMDVVLESGGLNEFANGGKTVLFRQEQRIRVRLDRILNRGDLSTNHKLCPGDVISVPERIF